MKTKEILIKNTDYGITLISLVITIVILLILVSISFKMAISETGVIGKSIEGSKKWKEAEENELLEFSKLDNFFDNLFKKSENIEYWDGTISENFESGDGTIENPYKIANAKQLAKFSFITNLPEQNGENLDIHAILISNIYLNEQNNFIYPWISICQDSEFTGTFDGNGFFISGLYFDIGKGNSFIGLFKNSSGIIKNLGIVNSYSNVYTGGMIANTNKGTIDNCYNYGNFSASFSIGVAGLIGDNYGIIENSYNAGLLESSSPFGKSGGAVMSGIAARNFESGIVRNCYNIGNLNSVSSGNMSGLVSYNYGLIEKSFNSASINATHIYSYTSGLVMTNTGTIKNCYNSGDTLVNSDYDFESSEHSFSNLVKYNDGGTIENCYVSGKIKKDSNNEFFGTIITYENLSNIKNTFYLSESSKYIIKNDNTTIFPNITPKAEEELKNIASQLGNDWTVDNKINNGYPILKWQVK